VCLILLQGYVGVEECQELVWGFGSSVNSLNVC
jgi:hypothetical protein